MKKKRVFLTLALAPGLLVGAGARIVGSKSVEQPAFAENAETLGYATKKGAIKSALKKTTEEKKAALRKTDTTSTEKKSAMTHRRKRHSRTRTTAAPASKTKAN